MRKIIYLLPLFIAGCATPKYSYYFDRVRTTPPSLVAEAKHEEPVDHILLANAENEPSRFFDNRDIWIANDKDFVNITLTKKEIRQERKKIRRETISLLKDLIKAKNDDSIKSIKADDSKNGFAVAGFVLSLIGLLFFLPLCILGVIFSALGLNSNRKGLAIAGLIIGVIGLVLILIVGALLAASF